MLTDLGEIAILQILVELSLAQLVLAARLGHEGQMGIFGQRIAERLRAMKICRGVFDRCSSAESRARSRNRNRRPRWPDDTSKCRRPAESHDLARGPNRIRPGRGTRSLIISLPSRGIFMRTTACRPWAAKRVHRRPIRPSSDDCRGRPASRAGPPRARPEFPRSWRNRGRPGRLASDFCGRLSDSDRTAAIGSRGRADRRLPALRPSRFPASEALQNGRQRPLDVALRVGVVDPQQELAAMPPGEQPIDQGRADAADVQITGRTGSKTGADRHRGGDWRLGVGNWSRPVLSRNRGNRGLEDNSES